MEVMIKRWGNSAAVRLPAAVLESARLVLDQTVDVRVNKDGTITIEPVAKQSYSIDDLLAAITPANMHSEIDFGAPVGRELA